MREVLLLLVMFWNLENFFDPFPGNSNGAADTLNQHTCLNINKGKLRVETAEYEPYTPEGEKFWTWKKFSKKRDDIAKSITLVKEQYGIFPAIVGLCEVENRFVLHQLTKNTILARLGYSIIHKDSPDKRGIDVAFLYRKELFSPLKVQFIPTIMPETVIGEAQVGSIHRTDTLLSRETVYVKGVFKQLDTLHCLVVHWPSKLGGEKNSLPRRMAASNTLKQIADSILSTNRRANIIVMGDFNDNTGSDPVSNIDKLVNMSEMEFMGGHVKRKRDPYRWFTYKYKESWSRIDHFLISQNLWSGEEHIESRGEFVPISEGVEGALKWLFCKSGSSSVFWHEFLLEEDNLYLGYKIRRTLVGPRYNGGVSDHLPIILEVFGYKY